MSEKKFHREPVKMVPAPSYGILPERDVLSRPVLETRNLGIDFGGLRAVEDFNLVIASVITTGFIRRLEKLS